MLSVFSVLKESLDGIRDLASDIDANFGRAITDPSVRQRHEVMRNLCPVAISGYFEFFLKDLARVVLYDINSRSVPYASLPARMKKAHYEAGGDALRMKVSRPAKVAWIASSADDLARRIGSTTGKRYELAWEAFADTQANPGPGVVREFLERYGCADVQNSLAREAGVDWNILELRLNDLLLKRNECAHTGRVVSVPPTNEIRTHCETVEIFAKAIIAVLQLHLARTPFRVDINAASVAEIARIPGVGLRRATAISAYIGRSGRISRIEDIQSVRGIGAKVIAALLNHAYV